MRKGGKVPVHFQSIPPRGSPPLNFPPKAAFKNHICRRDSTVARTASDLRLPQVTEAPADTNRPRGATAVCPAETDAETTTAPACQNFNYGARSILAHQEILGGWYYSWRVGLANSSPVLNFEEEQDRAPG